MPFWSRKPVTPDPLLARLAAAEAEAAETKAATQELMRVIASSPALAGDFQSGLPNRRPLYAFDDPIRWSTPQTPKRRPDVWITLDDLRRVADTYDILRSCVAPDTLVFCKRGLVRIAEVVVGDEVLTHHGRWRRVTECLVHSCYEQVYDVRARALDPLIATGNHPVYAARYRRTQSRRSYLDGIEWRRVDELLAHNIGSMKPRDALTLPALQFPDNAVLDVPAALGRNYRVRNGHVSHSAARRGTPLPAHIPFTPALGRLLGWYLAEGSACARSVTFSLGADEEQYAAQILADAKEVFGLTGTVRPTPEGAGAGLRVNICSAPLADLFGCGTARTKCLPQWAWAGTREFFACTLEGWALGDGHLETRAAGAATRRVHTSSKDLAWQMRLVAISLGLRATVQEKRDFPKNLPVIRGKTVQAHPISYLVSWAVEPCRREHTRFEQDGALLTMPALSVEPVPYEGMVYNLEVEEDESYVTTSGTIHNCIQHLKREAAAVPLTIVAREETDDARTKKRVEDAEAWFRTTGGLGGAGRRRSHFEGMVIEDLCVIGAAALWYQPNRGGEPYQCIPIDAATIRPVVDAYGWPDLGDTAYEQWVLGHPVQTFNREELCYDGLYPVTHSPYFKSPVEWLILAVTGALKADEWNRSWLTDGTTPSDMLAVPDTWTPDMIKEYYDWWTSLLAGNTRERVKMRLVPSGTSRVANPTRTDQQFQEFELWLLRRTCSIMGVQPAAIGFTGEQYKVSQEGSIDQTTQFGAGAVLDFLKALYDDMLVRLGYPELEAKYGTDQEEDAAAKTARLVQATGAPYLTINEARKESGLEGVEGGDVALVPSTLVPLEHLHAQAEQQTEQGEQALTPQFQSPEEEKGAPAPAIRAAAGAHEVSDTKDAQKRCVEELGQWQRKALNRMKQGKVPACDFESGAIPEEVRHEIAHGLRAWGGPARTAEDIVAVFRAARTHFATGSPWDRKHYAHRWQVRRLQAERHDLVQDEA